MRGKAVKMLSVSMVRLHRNLAPQLSSGIDQAKTSGRGDSALELYPCAPPVRTGHC